MKKLITTVLIAALLLVTLPLSLTGCSQTDKLLRLDEDERAQQFFHLLHNYSDYSTSYYMERTMSVEIDIGSNPYEQVTETTVTFVAKEDDLAHLEQIKTTVWTDNGKNVLYEDNGYADGMMFSCYKEGKNESGLKSPITAESYKIFLVELTADQTEIQVGNGYTNTMTCVQNQDKTWTATYEKFTEEGMVPFLEMLDGMQHTVTNDHELMDVRLTCEADMDFYITSMNVEYLFEENPKADTRVPEISIVSEYKKCDNTNHAESYDISDFNEVEDVCLIRRFDDALARRIRADCGTYTYALQQTTVADGVTTGRDFVTNICFDTVEGRFSLDMMSEGTSWDNEAFSNQSIYRDGVLLEEEKNIQTGEICSQKESPMTDSEARAILASLLTISESDAYDIIRIEVLNEAEGKYRLHFGDQMRSSYAEVYANSGGELTVFEFYVDIILHGNVLDEYMHYLHTGGRTGKAQEQDNQVRIVCSFAGSK